MKSLLVIECFLVPVAVSVYSHNKNKLYLKCFTHCKLGRTFCILTFCVITWGRRVIVTFFFANISKARLLTTLLTMINHRDQRMFLHMQIQHVFFAVYISPSMLWKKPYSFNGRWDGTVWRVVWGCDWWPSNHMSNVRSAFTMSFTSYYARVRLTFGFSFCNLPIPNL